MPLTITNFNMQNTCILMSCVPVSPCLVFFSLHFAVSVSCIMFVSMLGRRYWIMLLNFVPWFAGRANEGFIGCKRRRHDNRRDCSSVLESFRRENGPFLIYFEPKILSSGRSLLSFMLSCQVSPRIHVLFFYVQLIPNVVQYENWTTVLGDHFEVPADERLALRKKGHVLRPLAGGTICQIVVHDLETAKAGTGGVVHGELTAVSDPRKGGFPAGY